MGYDQDLARLNAYGSQLAPQPRVSSPPEEVVGIVRQRRDDLVNLISKNEDDCKRAHVTLDSQNDRRRRVGELNVWLRTNGGDAASGN